MGVGGVTAAGNRLPLERIKPRIRVGKESRCEMIHTFDHHVDSVCRMWIRTECTTEET